MINEQTYSACLNTSHYHQRSAAVDQSANFLAKATPTSLVLDTPFNFVSPQEVLPLPKAASRTNSNRRRGKTKIYTDTPVRDEIAKRQAQKRAQKSAEEKNAKRRLFCKRKKASLVISSSSSDEENTELTYNDNSDGNLDKRIEIKLGDYVVVLVAGKSRSLKYIARIDDYDEDDCEYEGVFLQKVNRKTKSGMEGKGLTFAVKMKKMVLLLLRMTLCKYFLLLLLLVDQKEEIIKYGSILT